MVLAGMARKVVEITNAVVNQVWGDPVAYVLEDTRHHQGLVTWCRTNPRWCPSAVYFDNPHEADNIELQLAAMWASRGVGAGQERHHTSIGDGAVIPAKPVLYAIDAQLAMRSPPGTGTCTLSALGISDPTVTAGHLLQRTSQ